MPDICNAHKIDISELYTKIGSSEKGLSSNEAQKRMVTHGPNELSANGKESPLVKFLKQFINFFAMLLLFGAGLSFLAEYLDPGQGHLYIAIALATVVVLNAVFTFLQEYQSEKIMDSFRKMLPTNVEVLRNGKKVKLEAKYLVPGDIIFLAEGDKVPADARLIEQNAMKVDHSALTGECEPQLRKNECTHENILESRNMLFSGTLVQSGNGTAIVYATGMKTQIGEIVSLTKQTKGVVSPLKKELHRFIRIISAIAISLGVVFFFVSLAMGHQLMGSIIFAIGIIVANVPEGLLPTVTLCLSIAAKRMAKKNALIKNLESVETLGSTTVICTDKTGTITENRMTVEAICYNRNSCDVRKASDPESFEFQQILKTMALCNNARYDEQKKEFVGDPTETALLAFAQKHLDLEKTNAQLPRVHESPFDSATKRMITTHQENGSMTAYMKGAPEVVLSKCNKYSEHGEVKELSEEYKKEMIQKYKDIAAAGHRMLAFAHKATTTEKTEEQDFIFTGLIGMMDPPRKQIPEAIAKCQTAGIRVIMMTGDFAVTAEAIARKVGMIPEGVEAMVKTGKEMKELSDTDLKKVLERKHIIFARINPIQKLRVVKALQAMGEVVTMTGDGVNDAPALKNADMGVSMGVGGTEVAREASNMVLLDDNFATIVDAVREGRTIFENIKKFIAYILTSNVPQILPFIAFALLGIPLPLTVVLILAIDLGTDIVPALGLGTEKSESDVMNKPPRSRSERLLTNNLLFMSYGIVGMMQAAAGFFAYFYVLFQGGWTWGAELAINDPLYLKSVSAFFASIIVCQIADVYICRTRRQSVFTIGFFGNKLILLGIVSELLILAAIVYLPAMNTLFGTHSLTLFELSLGIPFAVLIFAWGEGRKYFARQGNQFVEKYLMW